MRVTNNLWPVFGICLLLSGCDTYTAEPYGISMDNNVILKRLAPANVTVGQFTAPAKISMMRRLVGPIHLPGDVAPEDYISKAISAELELAGLSGNAGPGVTLTGQIDQFSFNSMIGDASWDIGLTVASTNGKKLAVSESYPFHASYVGDAACHNVADAFEPAVEALTSKLVADPGFPALLKN